MFGLVLAVALAGIGIGGALYALRQPRALATAAGSRSPARSRRWRSIVPFALGDRLASSRTRCARCASRLRRTRRGVDDRHGDRRASGGDRRRLSVPAADRAARPRTRRRRPRGRSGVRMEHRRRDRGSLAGGFGLMPLLGARGSWKLAVGMLVALGAVALFFALRERNRGFAAIRRGDPRWSRVIADVLASGRPRCGGTPASAPARTAMFTTPNALREWMNNNRRRRIFEKRRPREQRRAPRAATTSA